MAADLKRRGLLALIGAVLISACASAPAGEVAVAAEPDYARVFLVRHAEKETGSDPALTADGAVRAKALAARLAGEGVTEIWSTRTNRTEQTAAPLAAGELLGLLTKTPKEWEQGGDADETARIDAMVAARVAARLSKDWAEADRIRKALAEEGVEIMDGAGGSTWRRI